MRQVPEAVHAMKSVKQPRPWSIRKRAFGMLALLLASAALTSGCSPWRIIPPENVSNPAPVYITRYASHTRLALPFEDGTRGVEYGYGDWHWYAKRETGAWSGFRAVLLPMDGAYSRREIPWPDSAETFQRRLGGNHTEKLMVESERASTLRKALEEMWQSLGEAEEVGHPRTGAVYRRAGEAYHLFSNSNQQTASWLKALDCRVRGIQVGGEFRVERSPPP